MITFLQLIRFPNLLILMLAQVFTRVFIIGDKAHWKTHVFDVHLYVIALCTALIAASGYIINDYYDVKIDSINKPKEVYVGRKIKRRIALFFQWLFNLIAIGLGLLLSWEMSLAFFLSASLLWLYSNALKRHPLIGNITVALLTSFSVLILELHYQSQNRSVYLFALFAFLISLIREIIKDVEDIEGDIEHGCQTLPIKIGVRKTKSFVMILAMLFLISVPLLTLHNLSLLRYMMIFVLPPSLYFLYRLSKADKKRDFSMLSSICKVIILCGIFAMALA